jgi:hypothetical protein
LAELDGACSALQTENQQLQSRLLEVETILDTTEQRAAVAAQQSSIEKASSRWVAIGVLMTVM